MKRFLTIIFLTTFTLNAFAQTADDIINKFIEATGGKENLGTINTLQFSQSIKIKSPMGDLDIPMKYYKEKNKLFRLETTLNFGPQSMEFFTVISDTAGYVMLPANPMMGSEGGLQKMSAKEHANQLSNTDPAGFFSSLVDYAAKGHKVELMKSEKINNEDCYKIKQTLSNGQELIYFISRSSNLVVRSDVKGAMAATQTGMGSMMNAMGGGGRVDKMEVSTLYADYREFDGIKIPVKLIIKAPMGDLESEITNIQVNKPINAALYKVQ